MKKNHLLKLLALFGVFSLLFVACRNEELTTEHARHGHSDADKYVSFSKFLAITKLPKSSIFVKQSITAKATAYEDFDVDTVQIRQTMRNNTATAFSFLIYPKDAADQQGNIFYNLSYIKQADQTWERNIVKYTSNDVNYIINLQNNPTLKFQGSSELLTGGNAASRQIGLCSYTSEVEVWDCKPFGHTKIADCLEGSLGLSCCNPCRSFNTVTTIGPCSNIPQGGGITPGGGNPSLPPDGGSGGGEGGGGEFDVNLPLHNPNASTPCGVVKKTTTNPEFKAKKDTLLSKTNKPTEYGFMYDLPYNGFGGEYRELTLYANSIFIKFDAHENSETFMHSHTNKMIPIFSPGDVIKFNEWIKVLRNFKANNPNPPFPVPDLTNLTYTVVTVQGTYMLTFDGATNFNAFPNFTQKQLNDLNKDYFTILDKAVTSTDANGIKTYNMEKLEKSFLKFIDKKLKMNGLKIFRINNNERVEIRIENNNKKEYPCP